MRPTYLGGWLAVAVLSAIFAANATAQTPLDPKRVDAKIGHGLDQHFLDVTDIFMNVFAVRRQADDRITDDLAETVIGDLAAAIYLKNFNAELSQQLGGG